jgi:hypothetical protein
VSDREAFARCQLSLFGDTLRGMTSAIFLPGSRFAQAGRSPGP